MPGLHFAVCPRQGQAARAVQQRPSDRPQQAGSTLFRRRSWLTVLATIGMTVMWGLHRPASAQPPVAGQSRIGPAPTDAAGAPQPARQAQLSPQSVDTDVGARQIVRAYQLSRKATTIQELAESLTLCQQIDPRLLSAQHQTYLNRLKGWIHNRRGELFAEQAEDAVEVEDLAGADDLEAAALAEFHAALRSDPDNWQAHHNRGVSLAMLGQLPEAIQDFDATIGLQPDYANAWFNRAEIHYQLGQLDRAETDYGQVLKLDAEDAGGYRGRAHVRHELGKFQLALEDYNRLLDLQPPDAETLVDRADLQALMGSWEGAAGDYRAAIGLDPQFAKAYQNTAWMMATCPDPRFRNPQLAVKAARRALDLLGEEATHHSWDTWAAALAAAERYDEAVQASLQALALAPTGMQTEIRQRLAGYQRHQAFSQGVQPASFQQPAQSTPPFSESPSPSSTQTGSPHSAAK